MANAKSSGDVRYLRDDTPPRRSHNADMAKGWFMKEWRKHRGYSQQRLADMMETSKGYVSDIETQKRGYNQAFLEKLADALRCDPADILMRDPSQTEGLWSIWDQLAPVQREQVVEIAKTLKRTGT